MIMRFLGKRFSKGWFTGVILGVATSAALVYAAAVNIPNTFTSGQTIIAQDMNDNFAALENCPGNDANDAMVRVGALCVDKYEASVWDRADGTDGAGGGPQSGTVSNALSNMATFLVGYSKRSATRPHTLADRC